VITFTRHLARQVRAVFRRALNLTPRGIAPKVTFQTGRDGFWIRAHNGSVAAEYQVPGTYRPERVTAPFELLAKCEGSKDQPVSLEAFGDGRVVAGWRDENIPQTQHYDPQDSGDDSSFPVLPKNLVEIDSGLPKALHDAMETADKESIRFAVDHIELRGGTGEIVATDGRHLLVQSGFQFSWNKNVLIPRTLVFGSKELLKCDSPVAIGKTDKHVAIQIGPWTLWLAIDKEGRFPRVDDHIGKPQNALARFELSADDAKYLAKALKRLPDSDEYNHPVTVDLNGSVAIRAKGEGQDQPTELVLSKSNRFGKPVRLNTNRRFLAHAIKLGFRTMHIFGPESPVLCQDQHRSYVWALLASSSAIKPSKDAIRIETGGI